MADEPLPLSDAPQQGVFEMAGLAFHRNMLVSELAGHRDGLGEPFTAGLRSTTRVGMIVT